jgi:hypothetical protein
VFDSKLSPEQLPAALKLHLTLNTAMILVPQAEGGATIRDVKGPFTFDFTLPVDPVRRIGEINRTITTERGLTITLTRVIATRHHVRMSWRLGYAPPQTLTSPSNSYACCSLGLEVGGKSVDFREAVGPTPSGYAVADVSVLGEQGDWALATSYYSTWTGNMYYADRPGPALHFTLPAAITSLQP